MKNYNISIMTVCFAGYLLVVHFLMPQIIFAEPVTTLFSFESSPDKRISASELNIACRMPFATSGDYSIFLSSPEKKKVGRSFLDLTPGITNWSEYSHLIMDITNFSEITQLLKIYIADSKTVVTKKKFGGTGAALGSFSLEPHTYNSIDIDLSKKLKKRKIDISDIHNIQLVIEKQPVSLYLDNIKIIKSGYKYKKARLPDMYMKQFADSMRPEVADLRALYLKTLGKTEEFPEVAPLGKSLLEPLDSSISDLEEHIRQDDIQILTIYPELTLLAGKVEHVHSLLALWASFKKITSSVCIGGKEHNIMVGFATSMDKILPRDNQVKLMIREGMEISLAKGEKESFQTVVIPWVDIKDVGVTVSDLTGDDGSILAAGNIDTSVVGYVKTQTRPRSGTPYIGWWPDPILSFLKTTDIKAGDAQSFWIRINAPENQKPGIYRGTVNVQVDGVKIFSFKLTVRIYDFSMPLFSPLPAAITFAKTSKEWAYIWEDEKLKMQWADFLANYYISYDSLYARKPDFEVIKHLNKQGRLGMFNLGYFYRSKGTGKVAWGKTMARLRENYEKAKELGLLDHAYIYGCDEFRSEHFTAIEEAAKDLKKEFPGVMVMTTAIDTSYGLNSVLKSIDAWCPYISNFYPAKAETVRAKGKQVWWYTCCWPHNPYPNFFIECPAIEARLLPGFITAKFGPDGFLYYQVSRWRNNSKPITSGPFTDWNPNSFSKYNGDGYWTYVGPDSKPLATIRLENYRDGLEDYAYIMILDEIIHQYEARPELSKKEKAWLEQAKSAVEIPWNVVREVYSFTYDPIIVYAYRKRLGELIEESRMPNVNPWKDGMGRARKINLGHASRRTGFRHNIPVDGGIFGHNYEIPGRGFPVDFSDSFAHFGEITGSKNGKLISTPGGEGWVVYAFDAPEKMTIDSVDIVLNVWVANCVAVDLKVYWSIGDYDGAAAPDPENDIQWNDLKCDLYRTNTNEFQKNFTIGKRRFYLAYYLKNNNKDSWDIQVKKDSMNIALIQSEKT